MIELNRILCAVDFSRFSDRALDYAMKMAKWYGATLHVLHVMPPLPPSTVNELAATSRSLTTKNLIATVERSRVAGVEVVSEILESAEAAPRILARAEALDVDLIVTGSHGRSGMQRALLGSVVEAMLHKSNRPVLTIPSHIDAARVTAGAAMSKILCAVDFAEPSLSAAAFAFSIAEEADAQLTLLHVVSPQPGYAPWPANYDVDRGRAEAEAEALRRLQALVPAHAADYCTVETSVVQGAESPQILRIAAERNVDLIVLGVHGRSAFDLAFFGSNSKAIIREAHCPVLTVPANRRTALKAVS